MTSNVRKFLKSEIDRRVRARGKQTARVKGDALVSNTSSSWLMVVNRPRPQRRRVPWVDDASDNW